VEKKKKKKHKKEGGEDYTRSWYKDFLGIIKKVWKRITRKKWDGARATGGGNQHSFAGMKNGGGGPNGYRIVKRGVRRQEKRRMNPGLAPRIDVTGNFESLKGEKESRRQKTRG